MTMYAVIKLHNFGSLRKDTGFAVQNFPTAALNKNVDAVPQNPGEGPGGTKRTEQCVSLQVCEVQPRPSVKRHGPL